MQRVLVLSSDNDVLDLISKALFKKAVVMHAESVSKGLEHHRQNPFDIIFSDLNQLRAIASTGDYKEAVSPFTKIHPLVRFVVLTAKETIRKAVFAVKSGAEDYLTYPIDEKEVLLIFQALEAETVKALELDYLRGHFWKSDWLDIVHTQNATMQKLFESIRSVAPTIANVLLLGETGTGKGLMARLIHLHSHRNEKPFIAVHCGAIPDTLIESELFGHERGAFTGADQRKMGKFELARGGSIFLDEIGTITPSAQVKLLQVLQDGTFSRIGSDVMLKTEARIIAATNEDLKQLVEKERFRRDLYYRLNVFPLEVPPLRKRLEDLSSLIEVFLKNFNDRYGKKITKIHPAVEAGMRAYDWPGNIRELENILERAVILENSDVLTPWNFPMELVAVNSMGYDQSVTPKEILPLSQARHIAMDKFEKAYLEDLLKRWHGKIRTSAEKAGITPRQLNRLMGRYGLNKNDFKR